MERSAGRFKLGQPGADSDRVKIAARHASGALIDRWPTLASLLFPGGIRAVVQPIVRTSDLAIIGHEVLARMTPEPLREPSWWLERAGEAGVRDVLELSCLERAAEVGEPPDRQLLFVNLSPSTIASPELGAILDKLPGRLVIEISECEEVLDYRHLRRNLAPLLERGVRIAIDDAGAGYSSLRHVIELAPDFLKLDREIVRGLDQDPIRLALVRALVAFSAEVGTHVVAEGVETVAELDAVREAGVRFVQGYLTGAPGSQWSVGPALGALPVPLGDGHLRDLGHRLADCTDVQLACSIVVDHLAHDHGVLPSLYLERGGALRCVAQQGVWQVLDGMAPNVGITGTVWAQGEAVLVEDVSASPEYLEAIPGVLAEACVPIRSGERVVGALNVESFSSLPAGMLTTLEAVASILGSCLERARFRAPEEPWHAVAAASIELAGVGQGQGGVLEALRCLLRAAAFDSGAVVLGEGATARIAASSGVLAPALERLSPDELDALGARVGAIRSCYGAGDPSGHCFLGTDALRDAGARAVLLLPLRCGGRRSGTVVLAHSRPVSLNGSRVEPLEVLADHAAAVIELAALNRPA